MNNHSQHRPISDARGNPLPPGPVPTSTRTIRNRGAKRAVFDVLQRHPSVPMTVETVTKELGGRFNDTNVRSSMAQLSREKTGVSRVFTGTYQYDDPTPMAMERKASSGVLLQLLAQPDNGCIVVQWPDGSVVVYRPAG